MENTQPVISQKTSFWDWQKNVGEKIRSFVAGKVAIFSFACGLGFAFLLLSISWLNVRCVDANIQWGINLLLSPLGLICGIANFKMGLNSKRKILSVTGLILNILGVSYIFLGVPLC